MKKKLLASWTLALLSILNPEFSTVFAQGSAFTYQGRLNNNGQAANGSYDLEFVVFDSATGGSKIGGVLTANGVAVSNGLFTVTLDFGAGVFPGAARWLNLSVKTNGAASFTPLTPRQQITSMPYAVYAAGVSAAGISGTLPAASLSGTYGSALTLNNPANALSGTGSGLTSLNASQLASGTVADARLSANVALLNRPVQMFTGGTNSFAGKVGIGTTTPLTALQVGSFGTGDEYLSIATAGANRFLAGLQLRHFNSTYGWTLLSDERDSSFRLLSHFADANGTPRLFVDRFSGNFGIGTVTPSAKLEVAGTVRATAFSGAFSGDGSQLTGVTAASVAIPRGMVQIPAGAFTMGNSIGDGDISDAATVTATVSAFYMDVNLVSLSQWQSVYYWATSQGYGFVNAGFSKAPNHPVQTVDWFDCVKWCNARSQQAGKTPVYYTDAGLTAVYKTGEVTVYVNWAANGYRLPTEAEWEKAARGGLNGQRFPWGNVINQNLANYYGNTALSYDLGPNGFNPIWYIGGSLPATSPVGSFAANGYGLYDMAGNVFEWCWDWYGTPYAGGSDPHGPASGSNRVVRGGGWGFQAVNCRSAGRHSFTPISSGNGVGFRCVRGL